MAVLGADPDQLRDLAKQMRVSERAIADAAKRIGARLRTSDWRGTDAEDFRVAWHDHRAHLVSSGELLRDAADGLDRNAFEQEDASASGVCLAPPTSPGPRRQPVLGARLPDSRYGFGTTIGVSDLVGGRNSNGWVIEDLPGDRSRVWDIRATSVTVDAGAGRSVDIGPWKFEEHARIGAELGYLHRTARDLDDRDAWKSGLWHTAENTLFGSPALNWLVDRVEGWIARPTLEDHLLLAGFSGNVGFGAAAAGLGVSGAAAAAVGWRDRGDSRSLLVELQGEGEADLLLWNGERAGSLRVELPPSGDGRQPVIAHTTTDHGGQVEEKLITFELDGDEAAAVVDSAVRLLEEGKPLAAAEELGVMAFAIDPSTVTVEERSLDSNEVPVGFDGDIPTPAGPIGIEAGVEGFHETLD